MFDYLFVNGLLIDGSGTPWRKANVAVQGGKIAAVGSFNEGVEAAQRIDISGKVICPGFIDIHAHTDLTLLADYRTEFRSKQGITTEVIGQDGLAYAPVSGNNLDYWRRFLGGLNGDFSDQIDWNWRNTAELLQRYENRAANVVWLAPHGALRVETLGWVDRTANENERKSMQALLRECYQQGASGISTGLNYVPCCYGETPEVAALCETTAEFGGILSVHLRSYAAAYALAIKEMLQIGAQTGCAIHISHLRIADRGNWGNSRRFVTMLEEAREKGVDVTYDLYPYAFGNAPLFCLTPAWAQAEGPEHYMEHLSDAKTVEKMTVEMQALNLAWSDYVLSYCPESHLGVLEGKTIASAAQAAGQSPEAFVLELLKVLELKATIVAAGGSESDNDVILTHPLCIVGSDGIMLGEHPHPRGFGTYPRMIDLYRRQRKALLLEEIIYKMTGMPAARMNLQDRGLVRTGMAADLVVFSPEEFREKSSFENALQTPNGVDWVLVNGKPAVKNGETMKNHSGIVLRPCL